MCGIVSKGIYYICSSLCIMPGCSIAFLFFWRRATYKLEAFRVWHQHEPFVRSFVLLMSFSSSSIPKLDFQVDPFVLCVPLVSYVVEDNFLFWPGDMSRTSLSFSPGCRYSAYQLIKSTNVRRTFFLNYVDFKRRALVCANAKGSAVGAPC